MEHWAADLLVEAGRRRAHAARRPAALGHQHRHQRRPAPARFQEAGRQARHHLRPAGSGEGPGRAAARRRRPAAVRGRRRHRARSHLRAAEDQVHARGQGAGDRLRLHRRLRRLPRHLPAEHSRRRAQRVRARLSVRLARHPGGNAAARRGTDLFLYRPRLCALHHALADAGAALSAGRPRRGYRELARRPHLGRTAQAARRRAHAEGRQDAAEGHHPDAQLRGRADAVRPAVSSPATAPTSCRRPAPRA